MNKVLEIIAILLSVSGICILSLILIFRLDDTALRTSLFYSTVIVWIGASVVTLVKGFDLDDKLVEMITK